jgi:hypothetical protein
MNSTGRVGSHAAVAVVAAADSKTAALAAAAHVAAKYEKTRFRSMALFPQVRFCRPAGFPAVTPCVAGDLVKNKK